MKVESKQSIFLTEDDIKEAIKVYLESKLGAQFNNDWKVNIITYNTIVGIGPNEHEAIGVRAEAERKIS